MDGRHARRDANRKLVLDAAFRLFKQGGEEALTMRRLAAEAGVAEATPYNLFQNKTGVFVAMFEEFLNQLPSPEATNAGSSDSLLQFLAVTERVAHLWSEPSGTFCGLMAGLQKLGDTPSELIDRPRRGIEMAMRKLQADGWLSDAVSPQIVADRIAHANAGLFGLWKSGRLSREQLTCELKLNAIIPIMSVASDDRRDEIAAVFARINEDAARNAAKFA